MLIQMLVAVVGVLVIGGLSALILYSILRIIGEIR